MKVTTLGATILCSIAFCVAVFIAKPEALKEVDRQLHSGLFGMTSAQAVRLNVSNLLATTRLDVCDFEFTFYDTTGAIIRQGREQLAAGQSGFWDVDFQDVPAQRDTLGRKNLRAKIVGFHQQADLGCLASLELVNRRSGLTELLIGDPNQIPAAVAAAQD